ncbi:hypothetical protein [Nitratifractor sp.]|uniref:hypothetical protein n=1 Tax=Nitratifractor sp. TaxID=2268144 RepID=UPI0025CCDB46|nr:hypothetical protein [Nitratifractor sp.]
MRRFFRWLGRGSAALLLFLFLAYWLVPPLTETFFDTAAVRQKLHTVMLPSDQPKQIRLPKEQKRIFRAMNLRTYLGTAAWTLLDLPALSFHYLTLEPRYKTISRQAVGLFVDPAKNRTTDILQALKELNVSSVAQRIYLDDAFLASPDYTRHLQLAKALHTRGYNLTLVLAQTFESFDTNLTATMDKVVKDFAPYVDFYQIAEAVNRSKWGVPDKDDYLAFVDAAFDAIHRLDPTAKTLGPSVIDFEWFYTLYFDHLAGDRFDIANTLLYVDRVRQPENEQHGFDTDAKIRLFKAIRPDTPLWITEVNWPLKDQGRYKPTSNKEAVSETQYRDYMLRYLIIALGSGYVDRVYWWQLFAKGYGLIDHLTLRRRSAFDALAALQRLLPGSRPLGHRHEDGLYDYRFTREGRRFRLLWTKDGKSRPLPAGLHCRTLEGTAPVLRLGPTPIFCQENP